MYIILPEIDWFSVVCFYPQKSEEEVKSEGVTAENAGSVQSRVHREGSPQASKAVSFLRALSIPVSAIITNTSIYIVYVYQRLGRLSMYIVYTCT